MPTVHEPMRDRRPNATRLVALLGAAAGTILAVLVGLVGVMTVLGGIDDRKRATVRGLNGEWREVIQFGGLLLAAAVILAALAAFLIWRMSGPNSRDRGSRP
jgi:hypothetical protein